MPTITETVTRELTIDDVFASIREEVEFIEEINDLEPLPVASSIITMRHRLYRIETVYANDNDDKDVLDEIRTLAAQAVLCLKEHGVPEAGDCHYDEPLML